MAESTNTVAFRLRRLEDDVKELREAIRDYGAMKERVGYLAKEVHSLSDEVGSLRRALIGAALSVTAAAVIFAATMFSVLG